MRTALILGAGGFIGSHLVRRLKDEGFWVRGVDLKYPEFSDTAADDFVVGDLRDQYVCRQVMDRGLTRSISWPPIWAAPATFLPASMTPT